MLGLGQLALMIALASADDPLVHVRIDGADRATVAATLGRTDLDVLRTPAADGLELVVTQVQLEGLRADYPDLQIVDRGRPAREVPGLSAYPTLDELVGWIDDIAAQHPEFMAVVDLTATFGVDPTAEGRHIYGVKVSDNVSDREDEPAVLVVSNHHARELVTPIIALSLLNGLATQYETDSDLAALVDAHELWIVPTWNPDGYNHVFEVDNLWRKNRRPLDDDEFGVDLNRNYDFEWDSLCGGQPNGDSNTYRGPEIESEPETQTMVAMSRELAFAKVLDFHSHGRVVVSRYGDCDTHPFDDFLQAQATELTDAIGYTEEPRTANANGEHFQWQIAYRGALSFLVETHEEFQPEFDSAVAEADQQWGGLLWLLQRPVSLTGHITDGCTGTVMQARVELPEPDFTNDEHTTSSGPFGRYHLTLPPGDHTVRFTAPGFAAVEEIVSVTEDSAHELDVTLIYAGGCDGGTGTSSASTTSDSSATTTASSDGPMAPTMSDAPETSSATTWEGGGAKDVLPLERGCSCRSSNHAPTGMLLLMTMVWGRRSRRARRPSLPTRPYRGARDVRRNRR